MKVHNKIKEYLSKDIKEYNKVFLGLMCLIILMTAVFTSLKISNSYAIFTDTIKGKETITLTLDKNLDKSGANKPILSNSMIPVYYDSTNNVWKKADKNNEDKNYKWYDYDKKMWANSVTYDHTKVYNEGNTEANKIGNVKGAQYTKEGMTFDGNNDYIDLGNANVNFGNTITLVARFEISELGKNQHIISNSESAGSYINLSTSNLINFHIYSKEQSSYIDINSNVKAEPDKWYIVVGTYDGETMKLYVNGELKGTKSSTGTIKPSTAPIVIGAAPNIEDGNTVVYNYKFNGTISDALVMNSALSEDEAIKLSSNNNFSSYAKDENTLIYNDLRSYESRENGTEVPMDMISTMQVWIPRFNAVTPTAVEDLNNPPQIDVTFKTMDNEAIDAFNFENTKLSGFWVGKFENSSTSPQKKDDNTEHIVIIKPDVRSWMWSNISTFFYSMQHMTNNENIYGFDKTTNEALDTHMMKNREWGAVAYLTHSKYGLCESNQCREIYINNSSYYYTGRSGGGPAGSTPINDVYKEQTDTTTYNYYGFYTYDGYLLSYDTNEKSSTRDISKIASTTKNIYGIYDMSGGLWEYVMGNYNNELGQSGFQDEEFNQIKDKYVDVYNTTTYRGHALKETGSWYSDDKYFVNSNYTWFMRGGYYGNNKKAGLFSFNVGVGSGNGNAYSSRLVITNE